MTCRQRMGRAQRPHREDDPCWAPPLPNLGNAASARRLRPLPNLTPRPQGGAQAAGAPWRSRRGGARQSSSWVLACIIGAFRRCTAPMISSEEIPEVAGTSEVAKRITGSGLEMADRLVNTHFHLLREVANGTQAGCPFRDRLRRLAQPGATLLLLRRATGSGIPRSKCRTSFSLRDGRPAPQGACHAQRRAEGRSLGPNEIGTVSSQGQRTEATSLRVAASRATDHDCGLLRMPCVWPLGGISGWHRRPEEAGADHQQ